MTKFERISARWKGEKKVLDADKAGFSYEDFEASLGDTSCAFARGDVVSGKVVQYEYQGALVDIGAKSAAFMPLREAALIPDGDVATAVAIDETRDFQIISDEDENGQLLVSIRRLEFQSAWRKILETQTEDKAFEAEIIGVNRG